MFYIFTEDEQGRFGYVGQEYFSEVQAQSKADEYDGITHIIQAKDLVGAKRKLRDRVVRDKKDLGQLYKNVRNKSTLEV